MSDQSTTIGLPLERPTQELNRITDVDFRNLFTSGTKAIASGALGSERAVGHFIDACTAVDVVSSRADLIDDPGKLAWLLVHDALVRAVAALLDEHHVEMQQAYDALDDPPMVNETEAELSDAVEEAFSAFDEHEVRIDTSFFQHPRQFDVLDAFRMPFVAWLQMLGQTEPEAENMAGRLPTYFVYGLVEEWREHLVEYEAIVEAIETPFTQAAKQELEWEQYRAYLQRQVDEPVFRESFSLRQIYIKPRSYYVEKEEPSTHSGNGSFDPEAAPVETPEKERTKNRVVVPLMETLEGWVDEADKDRALRVLCGGPGIGKSSFMKMFASRIAELRPDLSVLFIPLHRFDLSGSLEESVGRYVRGAGFFSYNPLAPEEGDDRVLLLFDGLDELSMQGRVGVEAAKQFIQEVRNRVDVRNTLSLTLQVLVSGRDPVVQESQSHLRKESQVLHVVPYFVPTDERDDYADSDDLLDTDQRHRWWRIYAELKGLEYEGLPDDLNSDQLNEITAQPLLNYLLALSYDRGRINFSGGTTLNEIYRDLLTSVYERRYATGRDPRPLPGIRDLAKDDFIRMLEETALSAWHRGERTTTVGDIEDRCKENPQLKKHFDAFRETVKEGVTQLVTAFYFRQTGTGVDRDKTFEFTHKSFAEYLTARRLVREIEIIHQGYQKHKEGDELGWDKTKSLTRWLQVAGLAPLDEYLLRFLRNEIRTRAQRDADVEAWQDTLTTLFNTALRRDLPVEELSSRPSFRREREMGRDAMEALLAALNACARRTEKVSNVDWPDEHAMNDLLHRMNSQTGRTRPTLAPSEILSFLSLESCLLSGADLSEAHLRGARLRGAHLSGADLSKTDLMGANLMEADLMEANLRGANLMGANLREADLMGANLIRADFSRVDLMRAILMGANLREADLTGADLREAGLREADLRNADLRNADLRNADLIGADLIGADLMGANLRGADLREADLRGADLSGADLRGADLSGADLQSLRFRSYSGADFLNVRIDDETQMGDSLREYIESQNALPEYNR